MTDWKTSVEIPPRRGAKVNASTGCLILFALPFLLVGIFAMAMFVLVLLGKTEMSGDREAIWVLPIFGLVFGGVGLGRGWEDDGRVFATDEDREEGEKK